MKKRFPLIITAVALAAVASTFRSPKNPSKFDTVAFGQLPVLVNGRVKPLDTVARTSLLMMQGRQRVSTPDGRRVSHLEWMLDVLYQSPVADHYQVLEITHPELLAMLELDVETGAGKKRFAIKQVVGRLAEQAADDRKVDGPRW